MVEMLLKSYSLAYDFDYTALRYFNVCGADNQGRHGQEKNATHIIARVLEAIRDNKEFTLYGNNYPTPDGTCIRDYVHVNDIARAHFLAAENSVPGVYNLGTGSGYSNREIVDTAVEVTGKANLKVTNGPIREGDPAMLTCTAENFEKITGWTPAHSLNSIIATAWKWYTREL
jgi:UDP-glucose 4-epimerase